MYNNDEIKVLCQVFAGVKTERVPTLKEYNLLKLLIKRDLLKQRHAKVTERFKAQRFGVILTSLSREKNQFVSADI